MNTTDLILVALYFTSALGSLVFVTRYMWTRWWRTPEGRWIMGLHGALAFFGLLTFLRLVWGPDYPFRIVAAGLGFVLLASSVWGLTFLLFRAQYRAKEARLNIAEQRFRPEPDPEPDPVE